MPYFLARKEEGTDKSEIFDGMTTDFSSRSVWAAICMRGRILATIS